MVWRCHYTPAMTPVLEAVYADGWDEAVVNPMTPDEARARDVAGLPYAVLLLATGRLRSTTHLRRSTWKPNWSVRMRTISTATSSTVAAQVTS
jgi:hypothetical protein